MKEIKIVLSGEKEEQIAQHIMKSVYEAINEHGYCDINLCADTIPEPRKDIQIPTFLKSMLKRQKEKEEQDEGLQANSDSQG